MWHLEKIIEMNKKKPERDKLVEAAKKLLAVLDDYRENTEYSDRPSIGLTDALNRAEAALEKAIADERS